MSGKVLKSKIISKPHTGARVPAGKGPSEKTIARLTSGKQSGGDGSGARATPSGKGSEKESGSASAAIHREAEDEEEPAREGESDGEDLDAAHSTACVAGEGAVAAKKMKKKQKKLVVNLTMCRYKVVGDCCRSLGWTETEDESDWNLFWTDLSVGEQRCMKLKCDSQHLHILLFPENALEPCPGGPNIPLILPPRLVIVIWGVWARLGIQPQVPCEALQSICR